jgi:hypothetical protein
MRRRSLLRAAALGVAGVAGCGGTDETEPTTGEPTTSTATTERDPYRGERNVEEPLELAVRNTADERRYVTVVVRTREGRETVLSRSWDLGARERVAVPDAVAAVGRYDLVVETADGRRREGAFAVGPRLPDLTVSVGDGIDFGQRVACEPRCVPVSAADGAGDVPLPYYGEGELLRAPATLVVDGRRTGVSTLDLRLRDPAADATLLDRRYRVWEGLRLELPVVRTESTYAVESTLDGTTRSHEWPVPGMTTAWLTVDGAGTALGCRSVQSTLTLHNRSRTDLETRVEVVRDGTGETLFGGSVLAPADDVTHVDTGVTDPGDYVLAVETTVAADRGRWTPCEPTGMVILTTGEVDVR